MERDGEKVVPAMMRLTRRQVREVDRLAIERYGIPGIVLMENAARAATDVAWRMVHQQSDAQVLILCGGGNNGGDGLAMARHLHNRGIRITIGLATDPARYTGDARTNYTIAAAMKLPLQPATPELVAAVDYELVVDAVFGTGLEQSPRPPFDQLAAAVNHGRSHVLSIDIPSGLDADTGRPLGACIQASETITFVAEKIGFATRDARPYLGTVIVGDIGCPRELVDEVFRTVGF